MPVMATKRLGEIAYDPDSTIEFPQGLPGFEERRRFVAVRLPGTEPLVFLQSVEDDGLCFLTAPVGAIEPGYRLEVREEDLETIAWREKRAPAIGTDVLCLTVLSVRETGPSANLLAPVVVNLRNRVAVQAVSTVSGYSHRRELASEAPVCS